MRLHALPEALLTAILLVATPANAIWPFKPKRFRGNSLIQAGSMGVDANSRVVAFGDFNGDQ
jgi:integrin alpha FG-GAP repeat containing protein 1